MNIMNYCSQTFIALALVASIGCNSTHNQESTGEYVDDTIITTRVKAAILNDDVLKVSEINVETFKGTVQLSGFVKNRTDIARAVDVVEDVKGVNSVKNDLRVK